MPSWSAAFVEQPEGQLAVRSASAILVLAIWRSVERVYRPAIIRPPAGGRASPQQQPHQPAVPIHVADLILTNASNATSRALACQTMGLG
jgi:hypothetical protein